MLSITTALWRKLATYVAAQVGRCREPISPPLETLYEELTLYPLEYRDEVCDLQSESKQEYTLQMFFNKKPQNLCFIFISLSKNKKN